MISSSLFTLEDLYIVVCYFSALVLMIIFDILRFFTFWEAMDQCSCRATCQYLVTGKLMFQNVIIIYKKIKINNNFIKVYKVIEFVM